MASLLLRRVRNAKSRRPAAVDVIGRTADTRERRTPREQQLSRNAYQDTHLHCCGVRMNIHWPSVDGSEKQTNGLLSKRNAHMIGLKINFPLQCRQHAFRLLAAPSTEPLPWVHFWLFNHHIIYDNSPQPPPSSPPQAPRHHRASVTT